MPTIVVDVMPKAELLDPAGKAVVGALHRLGKAEFSAVRIGKRFELTVDGEITDADVLRVLERIGAASRALGALQRAVARAPRRPR